MAIRQMAFTSDEALLCSAQRMQLNVSALPCQRPPGLGQKEWESVRLQVKAQVLGLAQTSNDKLSSFDFLVCMMDCSGWPLRPLALIPIHPGAVHPPWLVLPMLHHVKLPGTPSLIMPP